MLLAPGAANDPPSIASRGRRVNDERGHRTAPGGFLEFVSPASVVSKRRAAKESGIVRGRLVREKDQNFALDVHALVIVPTEFGCADAVSHENGFGIEIVFWMLCKCRAHIVLHKGQRGFSGCARDGHRRNGACFTANQRHGLEVSAMVAAGLYSFRAQLLRNVLGGKFLPGSADSAAFEFIVSQ